jgi:hypothetical protein
MTPAVERWAAEYRGGDTIDTIARRHRVASSVVQRALTRAGVPMRGRGPVATAPHTPRLRGPGRPAGTHTQAVRVLRMVEMLDAPRTLGELATLLEVSERTVRRDLGVVGKVMSLARDGDRYHVEARRAA